MVVVVPELAALMLMLLALGIAFAIQYYVKAHRDALRAWFGWLPGVGHLIDVAVSTIANKILGWMQAAINGIDAMIGVIWHAMAALIRDTYDVLIQASTFAVHIAKLVGNTITHAILNDLLKPIRRAIARVDHFAHTAIKDLRAEVRALEKAIPKHLARWMRAIEHTIDVTLPKEIKTARDLAKEAEVEVSNLWDYVKTHPWTVVTDAFVGAVAIALSRLGLGWLRCNSNPFANNKRACGLWSDLGDLLGLATVVVAAAEFEELVRQAQSLEEEVAGAIKALWGLD